MPPLTIQLSNGEILIKTDLEMGLIPKYSTVITEDKIGSVWMEGIKTFFTPARNSTIHELFHAGVSTIKVFKDRVAIEAYPRFFGGRKGAISTKKDVFVPDTINAFFEEIQKLAHSL